MRSRKGALGSDLTRRCSGLASLAAELHIVRRMVRSRSAIAPYHYAAETGGAVSGLRVATITSGRKVSSRGAACFCPDFG